jgi:branched-chain amino acid aminotransferase
MTRPVWINGAFDGRIDPLDRGLTLGDGVFDTLVAFRRIAFAADRHLARLIGQAGAIGIPVDPGTIRAGWDALLGRAEAEHLIVRTTVTRGVTDRGLWPDSPASPTVIVSALPWSADLFARPARVITSAIRRNADSPASRLKSLGYLDHVLAAREALEKGASDALFLNHGGKVACTTIANVFAVRSGRLVTPPGADGVMPGIMRALVLEAAPPRNWRRGDVAHDTGRGGRRRRVSDQQRPLPRSARRARRRSDRQPRQGRDRPARGCGR